VLLPGLRARGLDARLWILVEQDNPVDNIVARAQALDVPVERVRIRGHADLRLWRRLTAQLCEAAPDVVHTHLIHADLYGIPAARRAGVPFVVSSRHNDDKFRYKRPLRLLNRWLWSQTDAGIAISEAIRQFSLTIEGAPAERTHTIHYGLNPATIAAPPNAREQLARELHLPEDTLIVGSICRLIEQKGLIYGLRGFAQIADQFPNAHYVLAGEGDLRATLEVETRTLRLSDRVHFLGWRSDAQTIFAALDIFLAPSLWEGFGLVFLEAMALSVPIISTDVSAIPEVVIDGETGWLVPPRDADAIAAALSDALANPATRKARGTAGRKRLETHFTVDAMVERTIAVYNSLETHG